MNGSNHIYDKQRFDREEKGKEMTVAILSIYVLMNQLDQFCNNFPVRIPLKITSGRLDGCKVKTMNLRLRSLLYLPFSL